MRKLVTKIKIENYTKLLNDRIFTGGWIILFSFDKLKPVKKTQYS